jgi:hypothetical protein
MNSTFSLVDVLDNRQENCQANWTVFRFCRAIGSNVRPVQAVPRRVLTLKAVGAFKRFAVRLGRADVSDCGHAWVVTRRRVANTTIGTDFPACRKRPAVI